MFLLSRALAAVSWGWRHGMRFVDNESDEYLRELIHHVQNYRHSTNRAWVVYPCFRYLCSREIDGEIDSQELYMFKPSASNLYGTHVAWCIDSVSPMRVPISITSKNFMYKLAVRYFEKERQNIYNPCDVMLPVAIYHMFPDKSSYSPNDDNGYYYIHVYDWITRCEGTQEVIMLLDAIQDNFHLIQKAQQRRSDAYRLLDHYEYVLYTESDPVRCKYVDQKRMQVLCENNGLDEVLGLQSGAKFSAI